MSVTYKYLCEKLGVEDLTDANLIGADLTDANLIGADLRGANLIGADLRGADIRGSDIGGADISGANLRGANIRWAEFDKTVMIFCACNHNAIYADGLLRIGCEEHKVNYWLDNYMEIAKVNDCSDEDIMKYKMFIDMCASVEKMEVIE